MRPPRSTIFVVSDGPSSFVARRVARQFFFPPSSLLLLPSASARATHAAVLTRLAVLSASDSLAPKLLSIGFSSSASASASSAAAKAAAAAASVVAAALRTASPRPSGVPRVGASAVDEDPPRDDEGVSHDIVVVVVVVVAARERPRGLGRVARAARRGSATFMSATALDMSRRTGARPSRRALTSQILGTPNCQIISFESRSGVIAEGTRGGHGGRE